MEHSKESPKSSPRIPIPAVSDPARTISAFGGISERERGFVERKFLGKKVEDFPPCSEWSIWIGGEVEGKPDNGKITLFIRDLGTSSFTEIKEVCNENDVERIFFTEEFDNWPIIREALACFPVCKAHYLQSHTEIPPDIAAKCRIYWKAPLFPFTMFLKDGDQICVGKPYHEEIFECGNGVKVSPADYSNDKKVI